MLYKCFIFTGWAIYAIIPVLSLDNQLCHIIQKIINRIRYMDNENIVICTLNNKWPFSYSLGMSQAASKNLAWSHLCKKKKNPEYVTQNTVHFVTYLGNVLCSSLNNVVIGHSVSYQKYKTPALCLIQLFTGYSDNKYHYIIITWILLVI